MIVVLVLVHECLTRTQETSEFVSQAKSTGPDLIHSFWSALIQTENFGLLRKSVGGTKAIRNISHAVD